MKCSIFRQALTEVSSEASRFCFCPQRNILHSPREHSLSRFPGWSRTLNLRWQPSPSPAFHPRLASLVPEGDDSPQKEAAQGEAAASIGRAGAWRQHEVCPSGPPLAQPPRRSVSEPRSEAAAASPQGREMG